MCIYIYYMMREVLNTCSLDSCLFNTTLVLCLQALYVCRTHLCKWVCRSMRATYSHERLIAERPSSH